MNISAAQAREHLTSCRQAVNEALAGSRPFSSSQALDEAIAYVLSPGGKRLRPALCLAVGELFRPRSRSLLQVSMAVELLHTASLVFDDLPCMDDATDRHGKPAVHLVHGTGLAVLCGHSLVSLAMQIPAQSDLEDRAVRNIVAEFARCVGPAGMAGGQADDLRGQDNVDDDGARNVAMRKTGYLFGAAAYCGAVAGEASPMQAEALRRFGIEVGTAYQMADDLHDYGREDRPDRSVNTAAALGIRETHDAFHRQLVLARSCLDGFSSNRTLTGFLYLIEGFCDG